MKPAEKADVMARFSVGALQVLVSTTVIEVGVDVPNASLMVIEHAERFGLSQLHQLRGRVGRGAAASVCVLLYTAPLGDTGKARLKAHAGHAATASRSPDATWRSAARASSWARASRAMRCCVLPTWPRTMRCCSTPAAWHRSLLDRHPEAALSQVQRWLGAGVEFMKA